MEESTSTSSLRYFHSYTKSQRKQTHLHVFWKEQFTHNCKLSIIPPTLQCHLLKPPSAVSLTAGLWRRAGRVRTYVNEVLTGFFIIRSQLIHPGFFIRLPPDFRQTASQTAGGSDQTLTHTGCVSGHLELRAAPVRPAAQRVFLPPEETSGRRGISGQKHLPQVLPFTFGLDSVVLIQSEFHLLFQLQGLL